MIKFDLLLLDGHFHRQLGLILIFISLLMAHNNSEMHGIKAANGIVHLSSLNNFFIKLMNSTSGICKIS